METNYVNEVKKLPDQIRDKEVELLGINKQILEDELVLSNWETQELKSITAEKEEDGKAKFSSDIKRKAELKERSIKSTHASDLRKGIESHKNITKEMEINLSFLKRTFRMHELFARVGL